MTEVVPRALVASEAAWLAHVNDDRVRAWFKDASYPATADDAPRTSTTWEELSTFCRSKRKRLPLPLAFLDLTSEEAADLLQVQQADDPEPEPDNPPNPDGDEVASLKRQLKDARTREEGLRQALREQLVATALGQDQSAAQRRALGAMVDSAETLARSDSPGSTDNPPHADGS